MKYIIGIGNLISCFIKCSNLEVDELWLDDTFEIKIDIILARSFFYLQLSFKSYRRIMVLLQSQYKSYF